MRKLIYPTNNSNYFKNGTRRVDKLQAHPPDQPSCPLNCQAVLIEMHTMLNSAYVMLKNAPLKIIIVASLLTLLAAASAQAEVKIKIPTNTQKHPQLLFYVSAKENLNADVAGGISEPNFRDNIRRTQTGPINENGEPGWAIEWADDGVLSWNAPGNIYAQRGTLGFFWRPRYPVTEAPFVIFRVGYSDHSSWDMAWMRIDWNGEGFDAFVTDANLARTRVSFRVSELPAPDQWLHLAFSWDETRGVRLAIDGREVARKLLDKKVISADFDAGLDQLGLAGRVLSPHQVQSRYNFLRGSDIAELKIYDRMLDAEGVAQVASNKQPVTAETVIAMDDSWLFRHGWESRAAPPLLKSATTSIRKVEFADVRDIKQWMWKGTDGIAETTWPGVYNRSRLPGRNDYFQLPDWNTYVEGGKNLDLTLPEEPINRIEIRGAAFGELSYQAHGQTDQKNQKFESLLRRSQGEVRSVYELKELAGGILRFSNKEQETPIQEIWAYHVSDAAEPEGSVKLTYTVRSDIQPDFDNLAELRQFIAGRFPVAERATVIAVPQGASLRKRSAAAVSSAPAMQPLVHILIPASVGHPPAGKAVTRSWAYGWENMYDGLDGVAIDLPALNIKPTHGGLIPLNIRVKDPIWPARDLVDVSVSVKPNQARTLWLDLRDRILTDDSFYLTIASASPEFQAEQLNGTEIRLIFKPRAQAITEHSADRFNQVRDNWGFLVEEHTTSQRQRLYQRAHRDISDLLRVDPDHQLGRLYWNYMSYRSQGAIPFEQPKAPDDVPLWAFRQLEELKLVRHYVNWWIDHRQASYGDFGGGISDDSDMVQQWPGLALMGVDPDKINTSMTALADAAYRNGMFTNGLSTIETDELHAYEEGINTNSALTLLRWGEPLNTERLMETVNALGRIIKRNPQGNLLFSSNWYSGKKIYSGSNWEWQKPYSFPILHPAIMLGEFNADRRSRELITGISDGYLAYGYTADDGQWVLPNEINWRTGETRGGEMNRGSGAGDVQTIFWTAWHWSGEEKYLKAIEYRVARGGPGALSRLNDNFIDLLDKRDTWGKALTEAAATKTGFENFVAWETTGDKRYLEAIYAEGIRQKSQSMYFNTEGHWWSDRVEAPHDLLQRTRLGGVALSRNRTYPGNTLGWRFDNPEAALKVALLVPRPQRNMFKVIAHSLSDQAQTALMTGWNVAAGRWEITTGIDTDGDDKIDSETEKRVIDFEKSLATSVVFPPRKNFIIEMKLVEELSPVESRPDVGIGRGDVLVKGNQIEVTVHSLGHKDAPTSVVTLEDAQGNEVARATLPPLAAPIDLKPKTATVTLKTPQGFVISGARVKVRLTDAVMEVTQLNNQWDFATH
jgi:hypothetical protein